jgi:hypothetical protein
MAIIKFSGGYPISGTIAAGYGYPISGEVASADTYLMARQHILWPYMATARSAEFALGTTDAVLFRNMMSKGTGAAGHYIEWDDLVLSPGDYKIEILGYNGDGYGIWHVSYDGADTGARIDTFATGGSAGYNKLQSDTFTVATKTRGTLRMTVDSANAGSTTYAPTNKYGDMVVCSISKTSTGDDEGESADDLPWIVDVDINTLSASSAGWAYAVHQLYYRGTTIYSDGVQGRWVEFQVWLPAGTWQLTQVCYRSTAQGIASITLDGGSVVGTIDNYGAAVYPIKLTATGIVVPTTKLYTVRIAADTKHASSSGYGLEIDNLEFRRTA